MRVSFHALAERELNDAAQYYERERQGLGAAFLAEIGRCVQAASESPEAAPLVHGKVRRRLCQRFPFGLLYTVVAGDLRILAVMHLRRRPAYWVTRR